MGYQPGTMPFPGHTPAQDDLRVQMAKLNITNNISSMKTERPAEHDQPSKTPAPLSNDAKTPFYEGWTLYRADPQTEDQKPSWRQATRSKMNLSQTDLADMVQKRKKKVPLAEQYQALGKFKRAHVDLLIKDRVKKDDPRFNWSCDYVDVVNRAAKGKGTRRGDYETISMDVIIVRRIRTETPIRSVNSSPSRAFGEVIDIHSPARSKENLLVHYGAEPTTQAAFGNGQQAAHSFFNGGSLMGIQPQHLPPPLPPTNPIHMMGEQRAVTFPGVPVSMPPTTQAPIHPAAWSAERPMTAAPVSSHMNMGPISPSTHSDLGIHNGGQPLHPGGMPAFREPQGNGYLPSQSHPHPPAPPPVTHPHTPLAPFPGGVKESRGRQGVPRPKVFNTDRPSKSPKSRSPKVEMDWPPEDSSVGDDESVLFELDYPSSATDDSSDEYEMSISHASSHGSSRGSPRGSLRHPRHSSRHERYQKIYRSHSEKRPPKTAYREDRGRKGHVDNVVDIIPENSLRARREQKGRPTSGSVTLVRPRVTYSSDREDLRDSILANAPLSSIKAELAYLEMLRDQERRIRDIEHLSSRRLQEREDLIRLREEDLEHREREAEERERIASSRFAPRQPSPREPPRYHLPGYQHHHYLY